ncbi:GNAT family N-acetyltransferase [Flavobacterium sp. MMLR14_040]|jgi:[ribosomal protein S5]-alanine N-acetyltransferase|uniref:GNAT family N-acetyltransferase n=1 Tax=Flavobacterium sp. MMLR14_040 TaxID=3093843 RepID=UPI000EADAC11|nr:GNAT family N-acetyltransferase [Flavobacterium sp. MMLR14_040]MDW8848969.1 GNAT family N-acetyltransferase [Flavobacterium sp. MMLR14_040]
MELKLKPIELTLDGTNEIYRSDNAQMLIQGYEEFYKQIGYNIPWIGYFVVRKNQIVGSCGFKGSPNDGRVEIAYWTFQDFEGHGIATFSCKELISIALRFDSTVEITATTAPEHNASTKILENCGFGYYGIVQDDEIGEAWLWLLRSNRK